MSEATPVASGSSLCRPKSLLLIGLLAMMAGGARAHPQVQTCPPQGPSLSVTGGRFGDVWSLQLSGLPGAAAVLGTDTVPGPVATVLGTACLGLSPALLTVPITLDATGSYAASGLLPLANPVPAGTQVYIQGAVSDPSLPAGAALTNAFQVTFRPPRVVAVSNAQYFIGMPLIPGHLAFIDPVSDAVATLSTLNLGDSRKVALFPRTGGFVIPMFQPYVLIADDTTGAQLATFGGTQFAGGNSWFPLAVSPDGTFAVLQSRIGYGLTNVWGVSPTGSLIGTAVLPTAQDASWVGVVPGTQIAWLVDPWWIRFVNLPTGVVTSVFFAGINGRPLSNGNQLYFTTASGLHSCDLTTYAISGPLAAPPNGRLVAIGPGPGGLTAFLTAGGATTGDILAAVSLQTLAVQTAPLPGPVNAMMLTAGGTEWLLEVLPPAGPSASLLVVNPTSLQTSTVLPSMFADSTAILRSDSLRKAYALTGPSTVVAIPTDPVGPPGPPILLPYSAEVLRSN